MTVESPFPPRLADGVELLDEFKDPGSTGTFLRPLFHWPVLALIIGYLLLHLPAATRALWHSAGNAASLAVAGLIDQRYASAGVDALSAGLAMASIVGLLFIAGGLVRRAVTTGLRWSAGRPDRQRVAGVGGVGALVCLVAYWVAQGQFGGW